jgi:hypothetical protein
MEHPHRSPTTAFDGRPVCPRCNRGYTPVRMILHPERSRPALEPCQSCRQHERVARLRKERGR